MLAALLQNNNNAIRQQPGFKVDPRASGGRSRLDLDDRSTQTREQPSFDVADIAAASALFPEIANEDPMTRAARRLRWISEALPSIKEAREKRDAAVFLAAAHLADAAAEERHAAQAQLKIEQIVEIIDAVRRETVAAMPAVPAPSLQPRRPHQRGEHSSAGGSIGLFIGGLVVGGLLVGHTLRKRAPQRTRR